jgi:hypothetical protein
MSTSDTDGGWGFPFEFSQADRRDESGSQARVHTLLCSALLCPALLCSAGHRERRRRRGREGGVVWLVFCPLRPMKQKRSLGGEPGRPCRVFDQLHTSFLAVHKYGRSWREGGPPAGTYSNAVVTYIGTYVHMYRHTYYVRTYK